MYKYCKACKMLEICSSFCSMLIQLKRDQTCGNSPKIIYIYINGIYIYIWFPELPFIYICLYIYKVIQETKFISISHLKKMEIL